MKELAKALLKRLGIRLLRTPANRFDALDDVLGRLRVRGFRPSGIIDAGANRGQWAQRVVNHYPDVPIVLIEPQPACQASLGLFKSRFPHASIEQEAVTSPGTKSVWMASAGWDEGSTGTRVLIGNSGPEERIEVHASTLDSILARTDPSFAQGPILLKLDLEGHEVAALDGGRKTLSRTEVIISETRLLGTSPAAPQDFEALLDFARASGFALYDFVSLSGRPYDDRLRLMDVIFVRRGGALDSERQWVMGDVKTG